MIVQLDANCLVELVTGVSSFANSVSGWMEGENSICTSSVAWSEFNNDPLSNEKRDTAVHFLAKGILPFNREMAEKASFLFNATGRRRGSHSDCMIAATAIISDAPLSTLNLKDFERFIPHGLRLHSF